MRPLSQSDSVTRTASAHPVLVAISGDLGQIRVGEGGQQIVIDRGGAAGRGGRADDRQTDGPATMRNAAWSPPLSISLYCLTFPGETNPQEKDPSRAFNSAVVGG